MDLVGKTVLIIGLARTGVSSAKVLAGLGAKVLVNDLKSQDQLASQINSLRPLGVEFYLEQRPDKLIEKVDFIVISPSVPIDSPFVNIAKSKGKEVISEIELAYRLCKAPIIAITGTNGKTTTTALVGEIFTTAGFNTHVVGNIGIPFIEKIPDITEKDLVVAEISSFQLEGVKTFRPKVCAILNITEDHLNRHKTMENYINTKARIYENAEYNDWVVLNADDPYLETLVQKVNGQVLLFSRCNKLEQGAWVENDEVVVGIGGNVEKICHIDDIFIPGSHNLENALAAVLMTRIMGVSKDNIAEALKSFKGIEHRVERVDTIEGVTFYNDSKGTNPDASIKAIQAMKAPTVLIAGGMDKGSEFYGFIDAFGDIIYHIVVLGETADKIIKAAKDRGFTNITRVNTLEEGVEKAFNIASCGENVLLSPACASLDMFKDYEERGRVFKEAVKALRR